MPAEVDLLPLSLPGHDGRLSEPPLTDLRELTAHLIDNLHELLDRPFAVLGHSMGAWIAFELMRELRRRRLPMPTLAILAASGPPDARPTRETFHRLPDDELVAALDRRYGGIPAAVRDRPALLQLLLPALRADLQMIETYAYVEEPPLDVDILAVGGINDPEVPASQLLEWQRHTVGECTVRLFPGGHFFLFDGDQPTSGGTRGAARELSPPLRLIISRLTAKLEQ